MKETVRKDPYEKKRTGLAVWILRLVLLFLIVTVCAAAAFLLYLRWLGGAQVETPWASQAAANLNPVQRLYLQTYLATRADELDAPIGAGPTPVEFTVEPGQSAGGIARDLAQAGLLQDTTLFLNYLRFRGLDPQLEAGSYRIDPGWNIPELALALTESFGQEVELRFLEGWRVEEMAAYLSVVDAANVDGDAFLDIAQRRAPFDLGPYPFLVGTLPENASLEGFLFPDTYRLPLDADTATLVNMMLRNFGERVTLDLRQSLTANGLNLYEAVTLASIVEREAPLDGERPRVAAVFYNRLAQDMPLQADPTVQYAVGFDEASNTWWKSPLTQADLDMPSPYNTYLNRGLPPGPIANPGLSALEAVAFPLQSNELFFVADCSGQVGQEGAHLFSETYEEHLVNVERCRQQ